MQATITSKGQLTLPKAIRDQLRLHAGDKLEFVVHDNGHVEMIPRKTTLTSLKGLIPPPVSGISLQDMEEAIAAGACHDDWN